MNYLELKKAAIEALSLSGTLYQEGNYPEALAKAKEAWNYYFELQSRRLPDEDFTDLIYAARAQYEKCKEALLSTRTKDNEYAEMMGLKVQGENGDHQAALRSAAWFANMDNWEFLMGKGLTGSEYLNYASSLYQSVLNNSGLWVEYRALAAARLGEMFLLPKFGNVDMKSSFSCFKWAADNLLEIDKPTEWLLKQSLEGAIRSAMYYGDVTKATYYAQKGKELFNDMGFFFQIAYSGLMHEQKTTPALIDAMVESRAWQGYLLKGIMLLQECIESNWDDDNAITRLNDYVNGDLSIYADEHLDESGGVACASFCVYKTFITDGFDILHSELMDYIHDGLEKENIWAQNFYGQICDLAVAVYHEEGDTDNEEKMKAEARKYLCIAANQGNRPALKSYYWLLVEEDADPELIEQYKQFASQYDIDV